MNASDNRSKKTIEALLKDLSTSKTIDRYHDPDLEKKRSVIIMDEVDGLNCSDRGGI